jgi:mRNA interferase MazF
VKRGATVTVAAGGGYGGKPRPAVVIQDDRFHTTASVTLCLFTTTPIEAPFFRLVIEPSAANGLLEASFLMIDKITTAPRTKISRVIGQLPARDLVRLDRALMVFLGLAG